MNYAINVLGPSVEPGRMDFHTHEFESFDDLPALFREIEEHQPDWQAITIIHVEDLPKFIEGPQ